MKASRLFRLRSESSLLDAASIGASQGISLAANIAANIVGFVAAIGFIDGLCKFVTNLFGFDGVDLGFMLGQIFIPISWALGVDWKDCKEVGNVIGTKTIDSEFAAYKKLRLHKDAGAISVSSDNNQT